MPLNLVERVKNLETSKITKIPQNHLKKKIEVLISNNIIKIRTTQKFCTFVKTVVSMHVGKIEETSGEVTIENDCYKICPIR